MAFTQVASLIYIEGSFELLTHPPINGTTKVKLTGCYPEKFRLLVILYKSYSAWMGVGGCCPLCPRYLLVLLTKTF